MKLRFVYRLVAAIGGGLLLVGSFPVSAQASPNGAAANLRCFSGTTDNSGYGGSCSVSAGNASVATLSNNDTNANGDYSGVYLHKANLLGQPLGKIAQLGYTWVADDPSTPSPTPGDLSLNIGVDVNGGRGLTTVYAYVDAHYCPGTNGVVDVIHDANCAIWLGGTEYSNWAALVASNPNATVGTDGQPFIVAERTGGQLSAVWTISEVYLGTLGR